MLRTSESTKVITAAVAEFHKTEVTIPKDSFNPFHKSKYADLWTIKFKCDPVLNSLGLVVIQLPGISDVGEATLITRLAHVSGEWIEAETRLHLAKDDPQAQGSAITYMRRYAYCAVLGIVADPDDDGEAAMKTHRKPSEKRAAARTGPAIDRLGYDPSQPPPDDALADVLHESLQQRTDQASGDAATGKQLSYLRSLIKDNGMADSDTADMVAQHCPPWPGELEKLSKGQAGTLIELLK